MAKVIGYVRQKVSLLMQGDGGKNLFVWLNILAAACIVIPLFYYSGFNFMRADDYSIGVQTHLAWVNREGLVQGIRDVIVTMAQRVGTIYMEWGGNYSSMVFTCLQPAVFNEKAISLNTYILLGGFIAANIYFFYRLFCKKFRFSWQTAAVMTAGVTVLSSQWLPSAVEGFYWFNGSFYNIAGYSMGLVLVANMYEAACSERKSRFFYIGTALVGIFVAGTNYTIMLFLMLLGSLYLFYLFAAKSSAKPRNRYMVLYLVFAAFCFVNILAPGNSVRQGDFQQMNPVAAVFHALVIGRELYLQEMNARIGIFYVVLVPFLLADFKKIKFRFPYPFAFSVLVYLLFSAMLTPTLFALHSIGPERTQNVYYWSAIMLHLCNFVYWAGWLQKKIEKRGGNFRILENGKWYCYHFCLCAALLFLLLEQVDISGTTTFTVMESVLSGEARQWKIEMDAQKEILRDPQVMDVVLEPLTVHPELLYVDDMDPDPTFWVNQAMAQWYQKNSIVMQSGE